MTTEKRNTMNSTGGIDNDIMSAKNDSNSSGVPEVKSDTNSTVQELRDLVEEFVAQRHWHVFHQPKNLAMSIAIEAAELMEHFQWQTAEEVQQSIQDPQKVAAMGEELADVMCYCVAMANALNIDISQTVKQKMVKNRIKYPA